jgi:hypothetical protein
MRIPLRLLVLIIPLSFSASAGAEKITIDDDTFLNIGVLLQPQFTVTENASPGGDLGTDFFLRRGRLVLSGQYDANIGFIFLTDQANWGRNGDYTQQFIIQDAVAWYKVGPEFTFSAGFMLSPFVRNGYASAGALTTVDYRLAVIKFPPTGRAFRDMGVEARGLLAQDRIYYRAGVFAGVAGRPDDPATPEVDEELNPDDMPRFTGTVRFNILGKEEGYAPPNINFGAGPVVNVGVAIDYQKDAYGTTDDARHLGLAADLVVDYPLSPEMELLASAAFIRYDNYALGDQANAFYVEGGLRYNSIEPFGAFEYFDADVAGKLTNIKLGLGYWFAKSNYNIKAEVTIPDQEGAAENNLVGVVQVQASF